MKGRTSQTFPVADTALFRRQSLEWGRQHSHCHFFTDNQIPYPHGGFRSVLAAGCHQEVPLQAGKTFESLLQHHQKYSDWLIGYFSYDLKNEIEALQSRNPDHLQFPPACFYVPEHLIFFEDHNQITIQTYENPLTIFAQIQRTIPDTSSQHRQSNIKHRTSKSTYLQNVERIREHILNGDVYELNYCIEFFAENAHLDPLYLYQKLSSRSPMPFSVFGRINQHYLVGASPERFLRKTGRQLLSQPIKGTVRRGSTAQEDVQLKEWLRTDEKERAENMMIVDLVRNDLARSAVTGSVRVEEMFGVYTFARLHQMISSVSATIRLGISFTEAIKNAFPMGSMTGAPKIKAMELIDQYEDVRRGLYSGAVGFITPEGDFDFNVVIRSILYNADKQYLSFQVGSAITYDAIGEKEYEECLLKAQAMREVLEG